jgi:DNA gyrase inhibitor GyrI
MRPPSRKGRYLRSLDEWSRREAVLRIATVEVAVGGSHRSEAEDFRLDVCIALALEFQRHGHVTQKSSFKDQN